MKLTDIFTAEAIALNWTEVASNSIPYLGTGLFPAKKKAGLDLKWIKGNKGLPVSLAPSNFDAKSTFRDRIGVSMSETQMAFFRESMLVKEADEQEIMRVENASDPYAAAVIDNIFDDARTLIDGADVVSERMRMQLLAPVDGAVGININANGVNYTYDYDPADDWKNNHYMAITTAEDMWNASETCDPISDLMEAIDAQEAISGTRPRYALMSGNTFGYIKKSKAIESYILAQNATANIIITSRRVREVIEENLDITLIVYNKKYKNEAGTEANFYPDDVVMLIPEGALGSTWYGTTPEERTLLGNPSANVSTVNTGIAVTVTTTTDPVNTKTTVSEIVLPSFERLNECYGLQVVTEGD